MKKIIKSVLISLVASLLIISCSSENSVGSVVNNLRVVNNTIQDTGIIYGVTEGTNPLPYAEKVKTKDAVLPDGSFDLYIVHTNDVHGRLEKEDKVIGYSTLSAFLNLLRNKSNGNVLALEAGDFSHGTNIANFFKGETVYNLLGYMGYDAFTLGNHEFNYGLKQLNTNLLIGISRDTVPLSNNIKIGGKRVLPPYRIFNFNGYKVGVIGITTPSTKNQSNPLYVGNIDFETNLLSDLQLTVDEVKKEAEFVIVLGHIGLEAVDENGTTSATIVRDVKGIDLFIDGHSHTRLIDPLYEGTTPIVQTGEYLGNIGVEVMHITPDKKVATFDYYLVSKADFDNPQDSSFLSSVGISSPIEDQAVTKYIAQKKAALDEIYTQEVARLEEKYDSARAIVRAEQCPLGKLVADALTDSVGADFAILNGGSFRADLGPGVVTIGNVNATLPFTNLVVLSEISGEGIYKALENGYSKYPELAGGFPQTNLLLDVDTGANPGERIKGVKLPSGEEIKRDGTMYKVATNDFLVAGGDGYTQFGKVLRYAGQLNEVLISYLSAKYPL